MEGGGEGSLDFSPEACENTLSQLQVAIVWAKVEFYIHVVDKKLNNTSVTPVGKLCCSSDLILVCWALSERLTLIDYS